MIRGVFHRAGSSAASAGGERTHARAARRALSALLLAAATSAGCNLIFGIEPGEGSGPTEASSGSGGTATTGSGGTATTGSGGTATTGSGGTATTGTQGGGGSMPDCPPSSCLAGECPVGELIPGYNRETKAMVVTEDRVLWANGEAIDFVALQGGVPATLSGTSGFGGTIWLTLAAGQLSWTNFEDGVVRGIPIDPPGSSPILIAETPPQGGPPAQAQYGRIAALGDTVYWATQQPAAIWRARADGTKPLELVAATGMPVGVAVDATHVYWADASTNRILRKPTATIGDIEETFASTNGQPTEIFLSAGDLFWVTEGGAVQSKPTSAPPAAQPHTYTVDTMAVSKSIVADETFVYWTVYRNDNADGQGEVRRAHRGGADMTTLTKGQSYFFEIVEDCGFLYWNVNNLDDGNPGKVLRMAKPMN